jgi:TRAP-type C4-dicarboxylate transport system permease small subunit
MLADPARDPLPLRAVAAISALCGAVAAAMIVASVLITCQMIWVRFVLGGSTIWQTETVVYLMIGATLLGLPYVQLLRGHVSVDLIPEMLSDGGRRVLAIVILVVTTALAAAMLWYSWEMFHVALQRGWRSDTVWGPPLWIPYLTMPLGFALYLLQLAADLWRAAFLGVR